MKRGISPGLFYENWKESHETDDVIWFTRYVFHVGEQASESIRFLEEHLVLVQSPRHRHQALPFDQAP